jgi:purine-binding chemotaxis protein CheW
MSWHESAYSTPEPPAADEAALWVVARVDEHRFALPLAAVERIVRAVAITPLPKAPPVVLGVIDVQGRVLPVLDLRRRFQRPSRPLRLTDQLSIVRTERRTVALLIDAAEGVIERSAGDIVAARDLDAGLDHLRGIVRVEDGLVLIHDLERFLSADEARALDEALTAQARHGG